MISEPIVGVYEGEGVVRLREPTQQLQKGQELLVTIMPLPIKYKVVSETQPSPLAYFRQILSRLRHYEQKYRMTSKEFYQRFQSGSIQEGPFDYFDWRVLYDGYRYMQKRFGSSRGQLTDA